MKKLFKLIAWMFLLLIAVVIIGGVIFLKTFDLNQYKSYAEKIVYEQTGRKLALNGEAGLKISLIPTIVLNDVSLSNASWAKEPDMIKAKSVDVSLSILPLLKKEIVIDTVNLIQPEVYLAINKDGTPNWDFSKPKEQAMAATPAEAKQAVIAPTIEPQTVDAVQVAQGAAIVGIVAKNLHIEDATLVYADLQNNTTSLVTINAFSLVSEGMDDEINLEFDGVYNGEKISGKATTGSIDSILKNAPDFPVKAEVKAYGAEVWADVILNDLRDNVKFKGALKASNPAGNFGAPALNLSVDAQGTEKEITLDLKSLNVAGSVITGKAKIDLQKNKPYIEGSFQSGQINLQTIMAQPKKTAFNFGFVANAVAAEFVPNTKLDLSGLNSVDANVKLSVGKLIVDNNMSLSDIQATALLNSGVLKIQPLHLQMGGGHINGSASINAKSNYINLDVVGKGVVLQDFWKPLVVTDSKSFGIVSGGKSDFSVKISGQGATLRQITESLNGQVIAVVGESKIQTGSLKYLSGNFVSQLLTTLHLERKDKNMDLTCAVVRSDITDGKAVFPKGITFNAKQMVVVSDGSVNLRNDKLNLTIHPFSGKVVDTNVVQALSSLVKVGGTIEHPRIALDNSAVIKNVVGVAAAGPAFLGSQLLLDGDASPCYTALKGTAYQNMFPAPTGVKATSQGVYQGTNAVINESVGILTDTAKDVFNLLKRKKQ